MEQIAPNIQLIINKSLTEGHVPAELKESLLRPLLKKSDLDKQLDKNFRPVSNLSWISKTLERVASHQLITHINNNNLSEKHQSAYKENHSTETALLRIKNDIIRAMDDQCVVCLVLLDGSSAFDLVSHSKAHGMPGKMICSNR